MRLSRRFRKTRWHHRRWGMLALPLLAVACAGDDSSSPTVPGSAPSASAGAGVTDETLRVAFAEPVGELDPQAFTGHFLALDMVYEPLVEYGPGGELQPGLATSWDLAPDGLTMTLQLREGVTFHDGTPFDAEAVKWNYDKWVQNPDFSFFQASSVIESVEVVDPMTVSLHLTEAYEPLLQELSVGRPVRFLSPSSTEADDSFVEPVGTGPWRFVSSSETGGVFERNDDYWGEKPSLTRVEVSVIPDSQTRVSALKAGEIDLLGGTYMAPINAVEAADMESHGDLTVTAGASDTTLALGFNPASITADQSIREAVSLATDVDSINQVLYGGESEVADSLFPSTIADAGTGFPHTTDVDRAAQALDDGGWTLDGDTRRKDGESLDLRLLVVSDPVHGQQDSNVTGQAIADELDELGVNVSIQSLDDAAYFDALANGEYDLAFFTTYGAPYDPSGSAVSFLSSTGGDAPLWTDDELDDLVDTALFASTEAETTAAYEAIYDHLEAVDAFVPITHPPRYYATGPAVRGFEVPATEYDMALQGVTVER